MNKTLLFALAGVALLAVSASFLAVSHKNTQVQDESLLAKWNAYKKMYGKKFADPESNQYRMDVFASNLEIVSTNDTYGMTPFLDLTAEEFAENYLTLDAPQGDDNETSSVLQDGGVEIDWVSKGAVTGVKNQGSCGSCWAFSSTGAIEGATKITKGSLVSLSEQYLVDCSRNGNNGCNGGLMDYAFTYVKSNGIPTEAAYPYTGVQATCQGVKGTKYTVSGYTDVTSGNCNSLLSAIQIKPVSIAVDATNFQYYSKGIFSNCGTSLNHGVLLVGYSASSGSWKVKNSWGTSWGESGYIQLKSGNTCGLCNVASYVSV